MTIKIPLLTGKIKKKRKKSGIRLTAKYRRVLLAKHYLKLKRALVDKQSVVMVVYRCHFMKIRYLNGDVVRIYATFKAASRLLRGNLFYHSRNGTIVNLFHFLEFKTDNKGTLMLFDAQYTARMGKKQEKNIEALKTFMQSTPYLNAVKKCSE
jgi:hypothetical protein